MDQLSYQRQILSQIGLRDLSNAVKQYQRDRKNATAYMVYILGSGVLDNANDSDALLLLNQLLEGAAIPKETIDVLRYYTDLDKQINSSTWDYFYNYRFTGRIETEFKLNPGYNTMDPTAKHLFMVECESCIIDILTKPLNMLLGFIEHMAKHWKKVSSLPMQKYYLPKMNSDLFIYIEGHIAQYYGALHPFEVGVYSDVSNVFNGYRFTGMVDRFPFRENFNIECQQAAHLKGLSTIL